MIVVPEILFSDDPGQMYFKIVSWVMIKYAIYSSVLYSILIGNTSLYCFVLSTLYIITSLQHLGVFAICHSNQMLSVWMLV